MNEHRMSILLAILAAVFYGVGIPMSKFLLTELPPAFMAALLYLGAGMGMSIVDQFRNKVSIGEKENRITKTEMPYVIGMIILDIAAPLTLMFGLTMTPPANASLLNNFEIVATSLIAMLVFKESISRRLWVAIALITVASLILSFENMSSFSFSFGSILVLVACICWGMENNCTRMISHKDIVQIVIIKGFGSGMGALFIALAIGEYTLNFRYVAYALVLGFVAYGLSIYFYILAQRGLGAARTSAYYAVAPFIGVGLSFVVFGHPITIAFVIALVIMIYGAYLASIKKNSYIQGGSHD